MTNTTKQPAPAAACDGPTADGGAGATDASVYAEPVGSGRELGADAARYEGQGEGWSNEQDAERWDGLS